VTPSACETTVVMVHHIPVVCWLLESSGLAISPAVLVSAIRGRPQGVRCTRRHRQCRSAEGAWRRLVGHRAEAVSGQTVTAVARTGEGRIRPDRLVLGGGSQLLATIKDLALPGGLVALSLAAAIWVSSK
jgi:hypothetical protein